MRVARKVQGAKGRTWASGDTPALVALSDVQLRNLISRRIVTLNQGMSMEFGVRMVSVRRTPSSK